MEKEKPLAFDEEELEIIRELLSVSSCKYKRKTHFYHCCDANDIIKKIDETIGEPKEH